VAPQTAPSGKILGRPPAPKPRVRGVFSPPSGKTARVRAPGPGAGRRPRWGCCRLYAKTTRMHDTATPEGIHWTRAGTAARSWRSLLRGHAEGGRLAGRGPRGPGAYHRRRARSTGARRHLDAPRTNERMDSGADGRRRRTARPLVRAVQPAWAVTRKRPLGRGLIVTHKLEPRVATSLPTRTRPPSRGVGPRPQSTRLRTQTGRVPPLAQRRLGSPRSPSQGQMRLADDSPTQGRLACPATPAVT
jgi:hypothetical protein